MDMLEKLFEMQAALDKDIVERRNLQNIPAEQWVQMEIMAMFSELGEILDCVNWKWWKNHKQVDEDHLKEEIVDVLHFFLALCLRVGMTPDELFSIYLDKNKENLDRQAGRSSKEGYDSSKAV